MANVRSVEMKGDKAAILIMDDDTRVWTPEKDKAVALVGKPIPADWTQKQGEYGPQAFPPRPKGAGAPTAYRNSQAGQLYEQEAMDRRTALMQAAPLILNERILPEEWRIFADMFYVWLRATKTSGEPGAQKPSSGSRIPSVTSASPETGSPDSSESAGRRTQSAGEEPGPTNGEVAASAPSGSTIDAQTVKDLQAVLGGPTNALHAARARFGDSIYALKNLTTEQAKALLP